MKPPDQAAQNDHLRLPRGLFLPALESNQLHRVQVDGEELPLLTSRFVFDATIRDRELSCATLALQCRLEPNGNSRKR